MTRRIYNNHGPGQSKPPDVSIQRQPILNKTNQISLSQSKFHEEFLGELQNFGQKSFDRLFCMIDDHIQRIVNMMDFVEGFQLQFNANQKILNEKRQQIEKVKQLQSYNEIINPHSFPTDSQIDELKQKLKIVETQLNQRQNVGDKMTKIKQWIQEGGVLFE